MISLFTIILMTMLNKKLYAKFDAYNMCIVANSSLSDAYEID